MTSLTLIALLILLLGAFTRLGIPRALALSGTTATGTAFILNDRVVISLFSAVAIAGVIWTALGSLTRQQYQFGATRDFRPGTFSLILFGLWATLITAIGPLLFQGTPVLDTQGNQVPLGQDGVFTVSNVAQLSYIWIGIAVTFLVARNASSGPGVIEIGLTVATLLNIWALLHQQIGLPFPEHFFDNSPNFTYIDTAPDLSPRFRGITSEPSALASVATPALTFAIASLPRASGRRRLWLLVLAGLALWLGLLSTSTSFIVSNVALLVLATLVVLARFAVRRPRIRRLAWVAISACAVLLAVALPTVLNFIAATITTKLDSTSYTVRSGSDQFSFGILLQTFGLGVGVGSNRPSSFVASILSQTGVPGFVLFAVAVVVILRAAIPHRQVRPVLWVALSFFIGRAFNGPDLGDSTGMTWLLLGVLAHAATQAPQVLTGAVQPSSRVYRTTVKARAH